MVAVEGEAARLRHVQAGVHVTGGVVEGHSHTTEPVDDLLEGAEVDLDVVVDGHAEVLHQRVDELVGVVAHERRVDAARPVAACDLHVQVAGERQHGSALGGGVDTHHHDRVAALAHALSVAEGRCVGRVRVDAGVVVGTGDEEILRFGVRVGEGFDRSGVALGDGLTRSERVARVAADHDAVGVAGCRSIGQVDLADARAVVASHHECTRTGEAPGDDQDVQPQ